MLKIRRPLGRLIFNMGIAIPGKTVLLRRPPVSNVFLLQGGIGSLIKILINFIAWHQLDIDSICLNFGLVHDQWQAIA